MKRIPIKNRNFLVTFDVKGEWDLNIQVIMGNRHNFVIDTGLGQRSVEPVLELLKGDDKPIVVINTHYHWDHVWGNSGFENATIVAHKLCYAILDERWESDQERFGPYAEGDNQRMLPNLIFEEELYFPEDQVRLIHTPGHTEDSIAVLDELEGVLNAGDNIGDTMDAIIPSLSTEKAVYLETILKLRELDFDLCLSGHNKVLEKNILDVILARL